MALRGSFLARLLRRRALPANDPDEQVSVASTDDSPVEVAEPNPPAAAPILPAGQAARDRSAGDHFHCVTDGWEVDRHIWDDTYVRYYVTSASGVVTIWTETEEVFGRTQRREQGPRVTLAAGCLGSGFARLIKRMVYWLATVSDELREMPAGDDFRPVANGRLLVRRSANGFEFSLPPADAAPGQPHPVSSLVLPSADAPKWLPKLADHLDPMMALLKSYREHDPDADDDALSASAADPAAAEPESRWHPSFMFVDRDASLPAWHRLNPATSVDPRLGEMLADQKYEACRVTWHRIGRSDPLFAGRRDWEVHVPGSFVLAHLEFPDFRGDHLAGPFQDDVPAECLRDTDIPVWKTPGLNCTGNWIGLLAPLTDEEKQALARSAGSRPRDEEEVPDYVRWPRRD